MQIPFPEALSEYWPEMRATQPTAAVNAVSSRVKTRDPRETLCHFPLYGRVSERRAARHIKAGLALTTVGFRGVNLSESFLFACLC